MKILKYLLALLFLNACIYAQGGSVYSRFGVGELYFNSSAKKNSIGELGTSLFDNSYLSSWNPASWSGLQFTRFAASAEYNGLGISDNTGNSYYSGIEFTGFMFAFPLSIKNGLTLSGGLTPYAKTQYEVINAYEIGKESRFTFQGSGSLSKLYLGASYRLPFDLSLGLTFDYYLGNYKYYSRLEYLNSSYSNSEFENNLRMRGVGLSVGLISPDIAKLTGGQKFKDFRLGLLVDLPTTLDGDSLLTTIGSIENEAKDVEGLDVNLPMRFAAGLSFTYDNNYQFIFDYLYQPWSDYKFNGYHDGRITDLHKFSVGVASVKTAELDETFWEHINLRGGLSYELMQYDIAGERLKEFSVYGGFSVPLGRENGIDISLQYGMRGKKDNNLLEEKIFKIGATLSFAELWFVTPGR